MSTEWHDPDNEAADDTLEPWMGQDEPPSKPLKPDRSPLFSGLYLPKPLRAPPPTCPKCGGTNVEVRPRDGALWCKSPCQEGFFRSSIAALLYGVGPWIP